MEGPFAQFLTVITTESTASSRLWHGCKLDASG